MYKHHFGGGVIIQAAFKAQLLRSKLAGRSRNTPRRRCARDGARRCATVRATTLWRQEIHHFRAVE